jgi:hypothetical protein
MDPQISLVEIDKLTYFMQQAGEGFNCHVLNAMGGTSSGATAMPRIGPTSPSSSNPKLPR